MNALQGLFDYNDKIATYWPEFGQNGKENVTIAQVFRHESGLAWFTEPIPTVENAWTENIKSNKMGEFIAGQKLHFQDESKKVSLFLFTDKISNF